MESEQKFDQTLKTTKEPAIDNLNNGGCFECNICLDSANEPVVTLCGHLYCWPCIYKWFYIQSGSLSPDDYPQCPVCKSEISHTTVVPLYGRGQFPSPPEAGSKSTSLDAAIPPRPPACGTRALLTAASQPGHHQSQYRRNPYQSQSQPFYTTPEEVISPSFLNQTSDAVANVFQPVVGLFGEMVYARVFGNSQDLYPYPNSSSNTNSYHYVGNSTPRSRRQEIQVDKSLSRISLFLLCCFLLCLLLF